jgi:hypothetical protein
MVWQVSKPEYLLAAGSTATSAIVARLRLLFHRPQYAGRFRRALLLVARIALVAIDRRVATCRQLKERHGPRRRPEWGQVLAPLKNAGTCNRQEKCRKQRNAPLRG